MDLHPFVERFARRFAEVESALGDPSVFNDQKKSQELTREYNRLKNMVGKGQEYQKIEVEIRDNEELIASEPAESEMAQMAKEDLISLKHRFEEATIQLQMGIVPPNPTDSRDTIVEIRAGAGGSESALFAADLFRMLNRYSDKRRWKLEVLDSSPSDLGGFKEIIFSIKGEDVFKRLKYESGVHRVQRVPATETQGRVHTSTCTVAVLPEAEEVDVAIKPDDIVISVCRASGPGGQGVNTTDSAVQIQHKPSGLIVRCADGRSQHQNKFQAMTVLRSRLLEHKVAEEHAKYAAQRKAQVGTGERNERIRTYNFPQNRVTDHRIELTLYNLPSLIEGDMDTVIEPLMHDDLQTKLQEMNQ
ncbi:MAG: peptide chain release factor 1 [Verrucomicrobia bacterium]|jgi:peptide chain release factor 1|nr:peptide chain release factor 1 [Verrucomicrobiota bacterium]